MQRGSLIKVERKRGRAVWQFRWSDKGSEGQRIYRKRVIGTVDEYEDAEAARRFVKGLIAELANSELRAKPVAMTVAALCKHFQQRELAKDDSWRSYSTRRNYCFCLKRWIIPLWGKYELGEVRTVEVESWLRSLPLARSTCAKIRNLMSVLFNHAWRHELFDRNPIRLVRQSAKRRTAPNVLTPAEIKTLADHLDFRERTLVLLAASTGLRQSELFGLKWGDIDIVHETMTVTRSIAYGVVGRCKTESSQKPVPLHPILADALLQWRERCSYRKPDDWIFASKHRKVGSLIGDKRSCADLSGRPHNNSASRSDLAGTHSTRIFDAVAKRWNGIQGHARADAPFLTAIHFRYLHASCYAGQGRSAGGGAVPRFLP